MDDVFRQESIIEVPTSEDALIVVDIQNDFCPGGALAVEGGDQIIGRINLIASFFDNVILTQDWHPFDHLSFASQHKGKKPFDIIKMQYGTKDSNQQTLWPSHCVRGTKGADFHKDLEVPHARLIVRKGIRKEVDSYSAFYENDWYTSTGLKECLNGIGVSRIYICGLATDYCVKYTALDAAQYGFETFVITDLCRGIGEDINPIYEEMRAAECSLTESEDVMDVFTT